MAEHKGNQNFSKNNSVRVTDTVPMFFILTDEQCANQGEQR